MSQFNVVMASSFVSEFDKRCADGVMKWTWERDNYSAFVWSSRLDALTFPNANEMLAAAKRDIRRYNIRGIVAIIRREDTLHQLAELKVPVIDVSGTWPASQVTRVHSDNALVGKMAARHLMDKGLRNFGFWGLRVPLHAHERKEAFVSELKKAGFTCSVFEEGLFSWPLPRKDFRLAAQWLNSMPKPVGVFCWLDAQAAIAENVCREIGATIPDQVAVIGVENDSLSQFSCQVPLTSIDLNAEKIGYKAMDVLDRIIRTGRRPIRPVLVPPGNVIERLSTDVLAVDDLGVAQAMRFILNNADRPISVGSILKEVPISRRHLEISFKKVFGRTPRQQIQHVHVERAKLLMENRDLDFAQIAESSGFKTPSLFYTIFRRFTKGTPGQYRRQLSAEKTD